MSKAKKGANPQKALLMTAVKRVINTNTVLPILEDILFLPGKAIVTDLETVVITPFDMKGVPAEGIAIPAKMFGEIMGMMETPSLVVDKSGENCRLTEGKRTIQIKGDLSENFPKSPDTSEVIPVGKINAQTMEHIATALLFVSNDDLRPAVTGVYFCEELVSTDAHRLYHKPIGFKENFIVPARSLKALIALGGEWEVFCTKNEGTIYHVQFVRHDGTQLISRAIDARFPDYTVVVPTEGQTVTLNFCPHVLGLEIKNAMKFANRSTSMVRFDINDSTVKISAADVDFSFAYENQFPATIQRHEKAGEPCPYIAFNGKFLLQILSQHTGDGPVIIDLWSPTKAAIVNNDFLIMPLMVDFDKF